MAKDKDKDEKKEVKSSGGKGGCLKRLFMLLIVGALVYLGSHIYFLFQPAGGENQVTSALKTAKVFPAIKTHSLDHIAGRSDILEGQGIAAPLVKERVANAIKNNFPITFREEEINAWLNKRVTVKQGGLAAPFAKARAVWVNFTQDEIEIMIERELGEGKHHITSINMRFERSKQGFTMKAYSSRIGQVEVPGGFVRLVKPAFDNLRAEIQEELSLYKDIHDIRVEDGRITLDPRRPEERK